MRLEAAPDEGVAARAVSPERIAAELASVSYIADQSLATVIFLALRLGKPVLLEGAPGVGKTEAAKAIAQILGRDLVRLQCYEGIDAAQALYEWNYQRQLLAIRQAGEKDVDIYDDRFLIARPLLKVLKAPQDSVLVVDEIDRADHEFEALLLEFLSDFQISIPERGTLCATSRPVVVLTSNRTRDLAEALRRRCVYHYIEYPDAAREAAIIMLQAGDVAEATARAVARAVRDIRARPLAKPPGIAEAIEWANAATVLEKGGSPWPEAFRRAIGMLVKDEEDLATLGPELGDIVEAALS
ncbi:AAA family ATPase [Chelatococcus asaccharovorans]|uniref:MoxR-like ATPase n=1 Tax=Chelatococcus asaccharovorans TaxID=28210 RepID=A0A2V3UGI3_9HYPH|nr:MoxR family ATPase [Chelatococcus asaccharovorans]MBS7701931.1 MoxR family ATPase [Chelatococcus asaccharovorans]PXW64361.1 MoxR-like ATPase [Chelatococcus asaccharovorans]CAH1666509.1 carbon monoxide dehydrogenase D protein [Chelatococcus asaccharovorans]CAH1681461.1 carbon monoxide dehydrogenase D protein [Chelatococcus asaccharovorans]